VQKYSIIVISHLGLEPDRYREPVADKVLAEKVSDIDLIIGGHTRTPTFREVEVNGTRIVHAGLDGKKVKFNSDGTSNVFHLYFIY